MSEEERDHGLEVVPAEIEGPFVAVLDYGIGNLRSAERALEHNGARARLCRTAFECEGAAGIFLPGVGNFGQCALQLRDSGLDRVALAAIEAETPLLAVCVGLQLLYKGSTEAPNVPGLGVFDGTVDLIPGDDLVRPHMQWNTLRWRAPCPLADDQLAEPWMYFVHSYAAPIGDETVAVTNYGGEVAAMVQHNQLWATQFHPEKSGANGAKLLQRFISICSHGAP